MLSSVRGSPLKTLLFYTILMITVPLTAFFIAKFAAESLFDINVTWSSIVATGVSVIFVHIILGLFVYEAYNEGSDKVEFQKED